MCLINIIISYIVDRFNICVDFVMHQSNEIYDWWIDNAKQNYETRIKQIIKNRNLIIDKKAKNVNIVNRESKNLYEREKKFINAKNATKIDNRQKRWKIAKVWKNLIKIKKAKKQFAFKVEYCISCRINDEHFVWYYHLLKYDMLIIVTRKQSHYE